MRFRLVAVGATVVVTVLLFVARASAQGFCFESAANYAVGTQPRSVCAADLDGDGDQDLVVANVGSYNAVGHDVSVLKNNGDGTFAAAVNYEAGDFPAAVFAADLDGDNDADLAVANYSSDNVSVLKNNGDGTFAVAVNYPAAGGPYAVFAADLDGDNDADLAVANWAGLTVSVLRNNGDGTFAPAVNSAASGAPLSVFAADLDGDDDADLTVANYLSDDVSVLKNNGDGTFAAAVNFAVGRVPWSVYAADLDGDGDADLAVANSNSASVSVLKNNGDGTFVAAVNYPTGYYTYSVFAADLDGDNDADLVAANAGGGNVSVLKNHGDGTFAAAVNFVAGYAPQSALAVDLDGDNDPDLAVTNAAGNNISVLINCGLPPPIPIDVLPHKCPNIITTDLVELANPRLQPGVPAPSPNPAVIPVAILVSRSFNARQCDPTTARLEGAAPQRWEFRDIGQPVVPSESECDCPLSRPDGLADLMLYFDQGELLNALKPWRDGDRRALQLVVHTKSGSQCGGSDCVTIREIVTITPPHALPAGAAIPTSLHDCWPNPFNASTTIQYSLTGRAPAKLEVFDLLGRQVRTLVDELQPAGMYEITWDGTYTNGQTAASGMYFYRLTAGKFVESKKMVMLK